MSTQRRSQARPLGNVQRRKRDDALSACQDALRHLRRADRVTRDLRERQLTGEGVKERGLLVAMTTMDAKEAVLRAIALLQSMTEETGPLDDSLFR